MKKIFLDIHIGKECQNADMLKRLRDNQISCAISIIPKRLENGMYSENVINTTMEMFNRGLAILGQHGTYYRCPYDSYHKIVDGAHENFCFYSWMRGKPINRQLQLDRMTKGKEILIERLGISPQLYVPPNHLRNKHTTNVAEELDFKYLAERGLFLNTKAHEEEGIILIPETKIDKLGNIKYVHYYELTPEIISDFKKDTGDFSEINVIHNADGMDSAADNFIMKSGKLFLRDGLRLVKKILRR